MILQNLKKRIGHIPNLEKEPKNIYEFIKPVMGFPSEINKNIK